MKRLTFQFYKRQRKPELDFLGQDVICYLTQSVELFLPMHINRPPETIGGDSSTCPATLASGGAALKSAFFLLCSNQIAWKFQCEIENS